MLSRFGASLKKLGRGKNVLRVALLVALTLTIGLGAVDQAQAAPGTTIMIMRGAVIWSRPSLTSRILGVLLRGRHFTVTGRSASGRWLFGITDRNVSGWILNLGFHRLHPNVNIAMLPIIGATAPRVTAPVMPAVPTQKPAVMPPSMGGGY